MTTLSDASEAISGLIAYCEHCAPGFSALVRPAPPMDVDHVIALAGIAVPAEYRAFLLAFGHSNPQTLDPFMADIEFGCQAIENFYRDPPVPVPPDAAYLWTAGGDCEMFLGVAGEWASNHPVVSISWPLDNATGTYLSTDRQPFIVAKSLLAYLYREAYSRLRVRSLAHHVSLRETIEAGAARTEPAASMRAERFVVVMKKLGLRPLPYLDSNVLI